MLIAGYYPVFSNEADAMSASPVGTAFTIKLVGYVYYMPTALTQGVDAWMNGVMSDPDPELAQIFNGKNREDATGMTYIFWTILANGHYYNTNQFWGMTQPFGCGLTDGEDEIFHLNLHYASPSGSSNKPYAYTHVGFDRPPANSDQRNLHYRTAHDAGWDEWDGTQDRAQMGLKLYIGDDGEFYQLKGATTSWHMSWDANWAEWETARFQCGYYRTQVGFEMVNPKFPVGCVHVVLSHVRNRVVYNAIATSDARCHTTSHVSLAGETKEAKVLMSVPGERFVDEQRTVAPVMEPRKLSVVEAGTELWAYANPHATNPMQRMHDGIISTHTYVANFAVFMFNRTVHVEELMLAQNAAPTDTNRRITPPSNLTFYALNPEAPGPFSLDENDWMHVQTTVLRNGGKYDPADPSLESTTGDVWTMQRVLNSVPTIAIKVVFHEQMDTAAAWP
eukprot:gene31292-39320_t